MGRLLLGEAGGLRVFPLRGLMKGGKEREGQKEVAVAVGRKGYHKKNGMVNGLVVPVKRVSYGGSGEGSVISTREYFTPSCFDLFGDPWYNVK